MSAPPSLQSGHYYTAASQTMSAVKYSNVTPLPSPAARRRFRRRLLNWYHRHGRDLPWRDTRDPYHILVSEIMLQQTQVDRVLPKYLEWLEIFPSFESLAAATPRQVKQRWSPLGYNVRPTRLHAIAREVVQDYGGQLPSDEATLRSFKGLGDYTVGAVRSFAFGMRAAIVDTNISRLIFRIFIAQGDPTDHKVKRHLWKLSETLLPQKSVFDFNQALMDFGATVCVARTPHCPECPMQKDCRSFKINNQTSKTKNPR